MKLINRIPFLLILSAVIASCGVYSFTGTNISPDVQTISFQNFYNDTDGGPPNLGQTFSDNLRDYFQQNTNLTVIQEEGDLQFEGSITGYRVSPVAATRSSDPALGDASSLDRITITIKVSFVNTTDDSQDFDRNFSFFADFDNTRQTLSEAESELINTIFDQIIIDIFNASVANW